ncbi:MAG: hypothetical protein NWT08_07275 [Akkermansiaceae bacterium]|nr:hypothetical protein [Akkermansiaceae bacterium]MDP4645871.1 hypothetical protein [Akkermansiaceae bacterium]MDP4720415.1 hypothetical protein [Akkermansiaceae bacterium]MDP4779191.1 hypothetical protein [Akkermansiaceae bacterium]MDP4848196.1 hypothetical protein [Akkermansiaceae bacterium]
MLLVIVAALGLISCASKETDNATPTVKKQKTIGDFMAKDGGYKQDAEGNWIANSDKRSSFDSQRDSSFKGEVNKETYKTGDYAKKSWWGDKEYKSKEYAGNTDGSRFQTAARQDGQAARDSGQRAREGSGTYDTKTLDKRSAREASAGALDRGSSSYVERARDTYHAPSIIDWDAQRNLSRDQSRSILGR